MRTTRTLTTIGLALALVGLVTMCRIGPAADGTASAKSKAPPSRKPGPRGKVEVPFKVENRSGKQLRAAVIQGGIPFAPGVVSDPAAISVRGVDGAPVPTQSRALMLWEDGSARWVLVTALVRNVTPDAKPSFTVSMGARAPSPSTAKTPGRGLAPGVEFLLVDQAGRTEFASDRSEVVESGPLMVETRHFGKFAGRERATDASVTVATFPDLGATRYRFTVKQLSDGAIWARLSAAIPHPRAMVYQQRELKTAVQTKNRASEIVFIEKIEPVDRGVGRTWEVWGFDDAAGTVVRPLRPVIVPNYALGTGAMGLIANVVPMRWQETFDQSVQSVYAKRDANPRNFGWKHYGDFFDGEHGLAYMGYVDQEYDPSTALWIAYARTGRLDYFDRAESLADFFRDMCLSPEGGTYQHRATVHAAYANVVHTVSAQLEAQIKAAPGYVATPEGLARAIGSVYGEKAGRKSKEIVDKMPASEPFETRQRKLIHQLANSVQKSQEDKLKKKMEGRTQAEADRVTLKDMMMFYAQSEDLQQLGYRDAEAAFAPFFKRYGGSWKDFPTFHVDILPDPTRAHTGSHSLMEMLVWAYAMTGDEGYRDAALRATRYHLEVLIPSVIDQYGGNSQGQLVESRNAGWPLINMMAAWDLTQRRDPDIHREVRRAADQLVRLLTSVPVRQHQGGIHAGVSLEGLCRYHEKTKDAGCARYITELARFWASSQWSESKNAFNLAVDQPETADASMTGLLLYGLAYANQLAPDAQLRAAIEKSTRSLESESTNYAKRFGQLYRSTPRAYAFINAKAK